MYREAPASLISAERCVRRCTGIRLSGDFGRSLPSESMPRPTPGISRVCPCGVTRMRWRAGEKCDVVVYGAGDHAKLFVNRKCVGKKKIKECKAIFPKVAYEPGSISAAIYDASGWELARTKMRSASGRTQIQLTPEKSVLSANGQDLCFLEIDLTGENGITKSSVDQKLTVAVEGAGVLQAFGSARPHMAEDFVSASHTTYYGKALAVIRAGYEPGNIRVTVSGDGLKTQERILEVVPSETTAI